MEYLFFFEDEGEDGDGSFEIKAENLEMAFQKASEQYGPQVDDMFCHPIRPKEPETE